MVYFPYLNHEWPGRFFCSWCINFLDLWWTQYGEPVLLYGEAAHPIDALCRLSSLLWTALVPSLSWEGIRWLFYFSCLFPVPKGNVVLPKKSFFRWKKFLKDQNLLNWKLFDISWPGGPCHFFYISWPGGPCQDWKERYAGTWATCSDHLPKVIFLTTSKNSIFLLFPKQSL